jgi:peptide subunit release factor 1 (eRF1)
MLTERDLQELLDFKPQHPVLSIYLNTDPSQGSADVYRLKLRSMLKDAGLPEDAAAAENYVEHEYTGGRSAAIFSCVPEGFFRAYPLQVPMRSRVRISNRPHVKPLASLFDSYGWYGIVLIDKQGARLFHFHLGEIREQAEIFGESIRRTKTGGTQSAGSRGRGNGQTTHTAEIAERNMRASAEFAAKFFEENNVRRVLLGGTEENVALFRGYLPKRWQSLVIGTFSISMTANNTEVIERAIKIGQEAEQRRETEAVRALITAAAKKQGGVLGLEDTLLMVQEGRIQTLMVIKGFRAPGYRCQECGYITAQKKETCPYCGNPFTEIPDVVDLAVRRVLEDGGDVDVLRENPSLDEKGKIGAILRY